MKAGLHPGEGTALKATRCRIQARVGYRRLIVACLMALLFPAFTTGKSLSDAEIDRQIKNEDNRAVIDTFLKHELNEVNEYAAKPLLKQHPSLVFFINQAQRGPLKNLFFLEQQVHELRKAQQNIDSLPYNLAFSSKEKKKILALRPTADKIVSYGIPLMKRDFYRVVVAARDLAAKRKRPVHELLSDPAFRDEIYRHAEPNRERLDNEMGELSDGEKICMELGWVLEQVTLTKWWLIFNDNQLPRRDDYLAFRKKRSEYWQKRLARVYKPAPPRASTPQQKGGR